MVNISIILSKDGFINDCIDKISEVLYVSHFNLFQHISIISLTCFQRDDGIKHGKQQNISVPDIQMHHAQSSSNLVCLSWRMNKDKVLSSVSPTTLVGKIYNYPD